MEDKWAEIFGDNIYVDCLSAMFFWGENTAFGLSKVTKYKPASISRKLQELVEMGILDPPVEDTSSGKLKKVYTSPSKEFYDEYKEQMRTDFENKEASLQIEVFPVLFGFQLESEDTHELLKMSKTPSTNLLEVIYGYLKISGDKIVPTNKARDFLKQFYEKQIRDWFSFLRDLDEDAAQQLLQELKQYNNSGGE